MKQILVIGSTGNVGRNLVKELAQSGEQVRAAMRVPDRGKVPAGVEPVKFDYRDPGTFGATLEGVDRVFVMGPPEPAPHKVMIPFIEAAARGGRKIVLMSVMGAELDDQASLRQAELAVEAFGAPFVALRPNWFMDNFHTFWIDPILQAGVIPLPAADGRTSFVDARDIAAAAAAALRTDRFDGKAFTLTGPEALTYGEAAVVVSKAAGKEIRYVPVSDDEFVHTSVSAGVPEDLARYLAALFEFVREGGAAEISSAVKQLTGHEPRTLAQYAATYAQAWR